MHNEIIGVLEGKNFTHQGTQILSSIGEVKFFDNHQDSLEAFLKDVTIIFVRLRYHINHEFIKMVPNLKFICTPTTGLTHIDEKVVNDYGIEVVALRGEYDFLRSIRATPEHAFGLSLSLLRNYQQVLKVNQSENFDRELFKGYELYKLNVGIIGYGRVGQRLARYFKAFDAHVKYYDVDEKDEDEFADPIDSMDQLINESELVLLSASYEGDVIIDEPKIELMKNKYFVNIARGELVDEEFLMGRIKDHHFKGLALDVIANETQADNNFDELFELSQKGYLVFTPHMAGATYDSMERTELFIINKLFKRMGML